MTRAMRSGCPTVEKAHCKLTNTLSSDWTVVHSTTPAAGQLTVAKEETLVSKQRGEPGATLFSDAKSLRELPKCLC